MNTKAVTAVVLVACLIAGGTAIGVTSTNNNTSTVTSTVPTLGEFIEEVQGSWAEIDWDNWADDNSHEDIKETRYGDLYSDIHSRTQEVTENGKNFYASVVKYEVKGSGKCIALNVKDYTYYPVDDSKNVTDEEHATGYIVEVPIEYEHKGEMRDVTCKMYFDGAVKKSATVNFENSDTVITTNDLLVLSEKNYAEIIITEDTNDDCVQMICDVEKACNQFAERGELCTVEKEVQSEDKSIQSDSKTIEDKHTDKDKDKEKESKWGTEKTPTQKSTTH